MQQSKKKNLLIPDDRWFNAPGERTPEFFPVFSQVSRALQQALRATMPGILFRDPVRYEKTGLAYPMYVYATSRPYRCRRRTEFSYDVLNRDVMNTFFRISLRALEKTLAKASAAVVAAGCDAELAACRPVMAKRVLKVCRSQVRYRRTLNQMLVMEARLLDELIELSACGDGAPRARAKGISVFSKKWNYLLRRFCGTVDFSEAGPKLLQAATQAMLEACDNLEQTERACRMAGAAGSMAGNTAVKGRLAMIEEAVR